MRLAYVCADPGVPVFGTKGCSVHVLEFLRALQTFDIDVTLLAARVEPARPQDLKAIKVLHVPVAESRDPATREREASASNAAYESVLDREGPFDMVYERYSLWSYAGMSYARRLGIPGVLEVNAPLIEEATAYRGLHDKARAEDVARKVFHDATRIIAVSNAVGRYVAGFVGSSDKIDVHPNAVDEKRITPWIAPTTRVEGSFIIGFVGSLKPWHGIEVLIEAFADVKRQVTNARLLIVGEGPLREVATRRLDALGLLDDCHFTGMVPPDAVPGFLSSMDVGVAPGFPTSDLGDYFSPLKVFEYMAAGLPTICSRSGQMSEVIDDGVNGLLFTPGSSAELAKILVSLARNEEACSNLGAAARATIEQRHTWRATVESILRAAPAFATATEAI